MLQLAARLDLNPLSEARGSTHIFTNTVSVFTPLGHRRNSQQSSSDVGLPWGGGVPAKTPRDPGPFLTSPDRPSELLRGCFLGYSPQ